MGAIIGYPNGDLSCWINLSDCHMGFDGSMLNHLGRKGILKEKVTFIPPFLHIAFEELDIVTDIAILYRFDHGDVFISVHLFMYKGGIGLHGLLRIDKNRQWLIFNLYQIYRFLSDLFINGGHCSDRLSDITYFIYG